MEDYHWYFVICLVIVAGIFLFVFIYTLNRTPEKQESLISRKDLIITDVNVGANTISFYSANILAYTIYAIKEGTDLQYTLLTSFNISEANTIYEEPSEIVLSSLDPGTYNIGYSTEGSGGQNIYSFTI